MWSWASNAVKQAGASVAQFGQDYLESVTAVDETEVENSKLLFDVDVKQKEEDAASTATSTEATTTAAAKTDAPRSAASENSAAAPPATTSTWLPRELDFAGGQAKSLFAFSKALVDRGAEAALQLLPDIESEASASPASPARQESRDLSVGGADTAAAAVVPTQAQRSSSPPPDPLDSLRLARGTVHLRFTAPEHDALRRLADEELNPIGISEFDLDSADAAAAEVEHVADTLVGKRIRTARRESVVVMDEATGELVKDDDLVALLPSLPERTKMVAETIVDIVLDELAAVFAASSPASSPLIVSSNGSSAGEDFDWYTVDGESAGADANTIVRARCKKVSALIRFAQCEVAVGANALSALAADAFHYAKRAGRSDVKEIKEQSLTVRGDCYAVAAGDFCRLEEAAECVASLLCRDVYPSVSTPQAAVPVTAALEEPVAATEEAAPEQPPAAKEETKQEEIQNAPPTVEEAPAKEVVEEVTVAPTQEVAAPTAAAEVEQPTPSEDPAAHSTAPVAAEASPDKADADESAAAAPASNAAAGKGGRGGNGGRRRGGRR